MATIGVEVIESVKGTQGTQGVQNGEGLIQDPLKNDTVKTQTEKIDTLIDVLNELVRQKTFEITEKNRKVTQTKDVAEFKQDSNGVIGVATTGVNTINNLSNGNMPGIFSDSFNQLGRSLMNKGSSVNNDFLSKALIGLGTAGVVASLAIKGGQALGNAYADATGGMDNLLANYGEIGNSPINNSANALSLRKSLLNKMTDTGLGFEDFVSLTNGFSGNGVSDINRASDLARESALWARRTGIDVSQTSGIAGLVERMGGNGGDFLTNSFKAAKASGLSDNQYGEFLEGIKSAMEQGISKGFKLSADDIGKNLSYVSMLSGNNPLWQGEYGAQRYTSMSNAMGNNTSLQSTSSMLMYQAVKNAYGGSELDILKKMEEGQWGDKDFLSSLRQSLSGAYGNDKMSQIASLKEMFGLNWTGGEQVLDIINNTTDPEELQKKIEDVVANKSFTSDETNRTNALNEINNAVVDAGQAFYETQTDITNIGATVAGIYEVLTKGKHTTDDIFTLTDSDFNSTIEGALSMPEFRQQTIDILKNNWKDYNNDNVINPEEITNMKAVTQAIKELISTVKENTDATKENSNNEITYEETSY